MNRKRIAMKNRADDCRLGKISLIEAMNMCYQCQKNLSTQTLLVEVKRKRAKNGVKDIGPLRNEKYGEKKLRQKISDCNR